MLFCDLRTSEAMDFTISFTSPAGENISLYVNVLLLGAAAWAATAFAFLAFSSVLLLPYWTCSPAACETSRNLPQPLPMQCEFRLLKGVLLVQIFLEIPLSP